MDLHKLVFEVKGLGCIVDEDSGFWEQLEAQFSSFYSICKSIRSSTTTLRFRLWAISERITPDCEERQKREGRGVEWRIIGTSNTENLLEIIEPAGKWMLDAR